MPTLDIQSENPSSQVIFTFEGGLEITPFNTVLPSGTYEVEMPLVEREVNEGGAMGMNTIDTFSDVRVRLRWQRKIFYGEGRFWVFWNKFYNQVYFKSSIDGINWTAGTFVAWSNYEWGETFNVVWRRPYVYVFVKRSADVYYLRGVPHSNGTITFPYAETACFGTSGPWKADSYGGVDSDGYPFCIWSWGEWIGSIYPRITKSTTRETFTRASGYPFMLSASANGPSTGIIALKNKDMLAMYCNGNAVIRGKMYDYSANQWLAEEICSTNAVREQYAFGDESWSWSFVLDNAGDVHLVFLDTSHRIRYRVRNYQTGQWNTEVTLFTPGNRYGHPYITYDKRTDDLWVFWPNVNDEKIYYIRKRNGLWTSPVAWIYAPDTLATSGTDGEYDCIFTTSEFVDEGKLCIAYVTGTTSPWKHRFDYLDLRLRFFRKWIEDGSVSQVKNIVLTSNPATWTAYFVDLVCHEELSLDPRVTKFGVKFLETLSLAPRYILTHPRMAYRAIVYLHNKVVSGKYRLRIKTRRRVDD